MTAKQRFADEYSIVKMCRSSLLLERKSDSKRVYITRTAFNHLDDAEDIREVEIETGFVKNTWVEVLLWVRL